MKETASKLEIAKARLALEGVKSTPHSSVPGRFYRDIARTASLFFFLTQILACSRDRFSPPPDTLVVALESSPINFDPRVLTDQASWRVSDTVFTGLMKKTKEGGFTPDLARSCTTEDARTWRCTLRKGIRFHDGRSLTSRDVAFTYESLIEEGFVSSKKEVMKVITSIETPSEDEIVFRLAAPYSSFPAQLVLGVIPEGTSTREVNERPVGTGPFVFIRHVPDSRLEFQRFEDFYDGPAKTRNLIFRIVPDSTTRALELLNGSLHLSINNLTPDILPRLAEAKNLKVSILPGSNYGYIAFNMRDPLLSRKAVRKALALALDREAIVRGIWRDTVVLTDSLLPEGHWARNRSISPIRRNVDEARGLLDREGLVETGGKPRFVLTYKISTDEMALLQATAIAAQWKEAGVKTEIRASDFSVFYHDVVRGAFQVISMRWQGITDPDHYHDVFHSRSFPPRAWNRGFYSNPCVDSWIDAARQTLDRDKRRQIYALIQEQVQEDLPYISLYTARTVAVHDVRVSGIETIPPTGDFTFLRFLGRS